MSCGVPHKAAGTFRVVGAALSVFVCIAGIGGGIAVLQRDAAQRSSMAEFRSDAATYAERLRALFESYSSGLELAVGSINVQGFSAASLRTGVR
jgi:hypothetical protein